MQLMALQSQSKIMDKKQQEMEDFKLKDLVTEYFKEQMEILDIDKLRRDFRLFHERMFISET